MPLKRTKRMIRVGRCWDIECHDSRRALKRANQQSIINSLVTSQSILTRSFPYFFSNTDIIPFRMPLTKRRNVEKRRNYQQSSTAGGSAVCHQSPIPTPRNIIHELIRNDLESPAFAPLVTKLQPICVVYVLAIEQTGIFPDTDNKYANGDSDKRNGGRRENKCNIHGLEILGGNYARKVGCGCLCTSPRQGITQVIMSDGKGTLKEPGQWQ